jgi:inorganic pyrophosphatase
MLGKKEENCTHAPLRDMKRRKDAIMGAVVSCVAPRAILVGSCLDIEGATRLVESNAGGKLMDFIGLPIGERAPHEVNVVVEIPRGSSNKVEYDVEIGAFRLDRVLYSPLYYPCEYGFVPSTLFEDGDPLDILVLATQPTFTGCIVVARPVGVLKMSDDKGQDDKILGVSAHDPRFERVTRLEDVSEHRLKEILHFFAVYKDLENKEVNIHGWESADVARDLIRQYRQR